MHPHSVLPPLFVLLFHLPPIASDANTRQFANDANSASILVVLPAVVLWLGGEGSGCTRLVRSPAVLHGRVAGLRVSPVRIRCGFVTLVACDGGWWPWARSGWFRVRRGCIWWMGCRCCG